MVYNGFPAKVAWSRWTIVPNPDKNQCTVLLYCRNGVYVLTSEIQFFMVGL